MQLRLGSVRCRRCVVGVLLVKKCFCSLILHKSYCAKCIIYFIGAKEAAQNLIYYSGI